MYWGPGSKLRVMLLLLMPMVVVTVMGWGPAPEGPRSGTWQVRVVSLVTVMLMQVAVPIMTDVTAGVPVPAWKLVPVIVMVSVALAVVGETAVTVGTGTGLVTTVNFKVFI